MSEPSAHPLSVGALADFEHHYIEGFVNQTGRPVRVPLFTQLVGNLWMGGCPVDILPKEFDFAFNLYGVGYEQHPHQTVVTHELEDSRSQPLHRGRLLTLAEMILTACKHGPTLVHCQAGLNRSGLLAALVLMKTGMSALDAMTLLRQKRDEQVLCNLAFEKFLRDEDQRMRP